jgi:hypothetical protein
MKRKQKNATIVSKSAGEDLFMKRSNLPGGGILNSSLMSVSDSEKMSAFNTTYKNFGLKAGVVVEVYETDDERNISGLVPEYDVLVIEQSEDRETSVIRYKNCISADSFGSVADFFEFRYRKNEKKDSKDKGNPIKQNGALVMMLCLDGSAEKGVILGGMRHPSRKEHLTKDKGLHMHGEYNGLNFEVNKQGAFKVTFKGPKDNDGKYINEEAGGTFLKIDEKGSVEIEADVEDFFKINKPNGDITVGASRDIGMKSARNMSLNSGGDFNLSVDGSGSFGIEGKADVTIGSTFDLDISAAMSISVGSLDINSDGPTSIKAPVITLDGTTNVGGAGGLPALTFSARFIGTGNKGAPVISSIMSGFSSKVFIAS